MATETGEKLIAEQLAHDPAVVAAKKELVAALVKHQGKITGIKEATHPLPYEALLEKFATLRGAPLFYPYLGSGVGKGALVELIDGSIKYDMISGVGVHFGHSSPLLVEASLEGAMQDVVMQGNLQQNKIAVELCDLLVRTSGLDHCMLTTSGAMANENALKMALQKKAPASRILTFESCFMGRTLTLCQITDRPLYREGMPLNVPVDYVPFYDWRHPKKSTERACAKLKEHLRRYPNAHAAMCFEMIQGEGGNYPGTHEFFMALINILREHKIPVLVDEVQTFGRTDQPFAFQHFGLTPYVDLVTVGKLLQTCATLFRKEFAPRPGLVTQTFISSTSALHASVALLKDLVSGDYFGVEGKNKKIRTHFVQRLKAIAEGPYGCGLMIAMTPYEGNREKVIAYAKRLFDAGVIAFIAGHDPTRLRFLVPVGGIEIEDLDRVADILEEQL